MFQSEYDYVFKILIVGDSAVGKSSLLMRFCEDIFPNNFLPTIGVDFKIRTFQTAGSIVKLQMWDTAGQQKFKTLTSAYFRGAQGIILVFDITNRKSFYDLQDWIAQADKHARQDVVKILIGNKKDLDFQRQVSQDEAVCFADSVGMKYLEASAKEGINIEQSFSDLVVDMKKTSNSRPQPTKPSLATLQKLQIQRNKQKSCC